MSGKQSVWLQECVENDRKQPEGEAMKEKGRENRAEEKTNGIAEKAGMQEQMRQMVETYKSRRNALVPLLDDLPNTTYVYPKGAFYLFISLTHYRPYLPNDTSFSMAISNRLLEDYGVAVVPGIAFGNDDCIRISYATKLEWVVEGLQKISHFLKSLEEMAK